MGLMKLTGRWEDFDPNKFKEIVLKLHAVFPDGALSTEIETRISNKLLLDSLIKQGYLIKESENLKDGKNKNWYVLGPNSLSLVSAWKMEESSKRMERISLSVEKMTAIIVVLTIVLMGSGILSFSMRIALGIVSIGILLYFLLLFYTPRQLLGIK